MKAFRIMDDSMRKEMLELLDHEETSDSPSGKTGRLFPLAADPLTKMVPDKVKEEARDYLHFFVLHRLDYKFLWTMYYVLLCLLCGGIIAGTDGIAYVDGLFMAASAMTGAGLSTVGMYELSTGSFQIMAALMMVGCAPFMFMALIVCRRWGFSAATAAVDKLRREKLLPPEKRLSKAERAVVEDCFLVDEALGVLGFVALAYYAGVILTGVLVLYAALCLFPLQEELAQRHFSYVDNATFLTISAFANAGLTLTSDNLIGLSHNPAAYVLLTFLIVAGNTAMPIFLRLFVSLLLHVETRLVARFYPHYEPVDGDGDVDGDAAVDAARRSAADRPTVAPRAVRESPRARYRRVLQFILDHPRRLTPYIFSHLQTKVLAALVAVLVLTQYVFFLGSTLNRSAALQRHSRSALAGIGYFQTLSTRSAGFAMMDLRELSQGLLFVYAVMMYMSAFPFVATLEKSANADTSKPPTPTAHAAKRAKRPVATAVAAAADATAPTANPLHATTTVAQRRRTTSLLPLPPQLTLPGDGAHHDVDLGAMDDADIKAAHINKKFLSHFLLRHSFFLVAAVLVCAYAEDAMLTDPQAQANLWYVIFEIVSAYGNVGLSLGVPGQVYSLSGAMSATGKAVMIALMWLGKHRGLPSAKDEVVDFGWDRYLVACRFYDDDSAAGGGVGSGGGGDEAVAGDQQASHTDDGVADAV